MHTALTCPRLEALPGIHSFKRGCLLQAPFAARSARLTPASSRTTFSSAAVVDTPLKEARSTGVPSTVTAPRIARESLQTLEAQLDNGAAVGALRRFNQNLKNLPASSWGEKLRPVMHELAYNLESFNPAFTAVLLKVQSTIGHSDYVQRDEALRLLVQPLAGEYGMHNDEPQGKTHRQLFSEFSQDLMHESLESLLEQGARPPAGVTLFQQMMQDIMSGGQQSEIVAQASYALGYNLAIEYLADYEKTWMLDSFRQLDARVLKPQHRALTQWLFLEVHAEGEAEHAALGHAAVTAFVPAEHHDLLQSAMLDHDRDFAVFYNHLADLLE
ncbi:hypothetical protein WJX74_005098 [Apatococcus lobatus]|uniref:Uncharacterized protein n=1 Tax=Apatococcus lobatus TaxID=904363 RepID=A0AAW1S705_9CHLO